MVEKKRILMIIPNLDFGGAQTSLSRITLLLNPFCILTIVVFTFSIFINIGLALCLGKYFGETYYGFFIISFVYLLLGIILYIFKNKWIKYPVSNFIISQMSNNETI